MSDKWYDWWVFFTTTPCTGSPVGGGDTAVPEAQTFFRWHICWKKNVFFKKKCFLSIRKMQRKKRRKSPEDPPKKVRLFQHSVGPDEQCSTVQPGSHLCPPGFSRMDRWLQWAPWRSTWTPAPCSSPSLRWPSSRSQGRPGGRGASSRHLKHRRKMASGDVSFQPRWGLTE